MFVSFRTLARKRFISLLSSSLVQKDVSVHKLKKKLESYIEKQRDRQISFAEKHRTLSSYENIIDVAGYREAVSFIPEGPEYLPVNGDSYFNDLLTLDIVRRYSHLSHYRDSGNYKNIDYIVFVLSLSTDTDEKFEAVCKGAITILKTWLFKWADIAKDIKEEGKDELSGYLEWFKDSLVEYMSLHSLTDFDEALDRMHDNVSKYFVSINPQSSDTWMKGIYSFVKLMSSNRHLFINFDLQTKERKLFESAGWPDHLRCGGDTTTACCLFGDLTVSPVSFTKNGTVSVTPDDLCDGDGKMLPYEAALKVIESKYSELEGTGELEDFYDELHNDCPENEGIFREYITHTYGEHIEYLHSFEFTDEEYLFSGVPDSGYSCSITYGYGGATYTAIVLETGSSSADEIMSKAAVEHLKDGFDDVYGACWLQSAGILESGEIPRMGSYRDLDEGMQRSFIGWCERVVGIDGYDHVLSGYDGVMDTFRSDNYPGIEIVTRRDI